MSKSGKRSESGLGNRIKKALVELSKTRSSKEAFSVKVGQNKRIVGVEDEYRIRLPSTRLSKRTEIELPNKIISSKERNSSLEK